jgi:hypothetical protein
VALGSIGGFGSVSPESGNVWDDREEDRPDDVVVAGDEQNCSSRPACPPSTAAGASQIPAGSLTGLVAITESSTAGRRADRRVTHVSRLELGGVERSAAQRVARVRDLRHRRAQLKVGYQAAYQISNQIQNADNMVSYAFTNKVPQSFTLHVANASFADRTRYDAFRQDQWTKDRRLTLQGGLRYEHAWSWFPSEGNGIVAPSQFYPKTLVMPDTKRATVITTSRREWAWLRCVRQRQDVRSEANLSKYLQPANNEGPFIISNPMVSFSNPGSGPATTTRSWTDSEQQLQSDCGPNGLASNTSYNGSAVGFRTSAASMHDASFARPVPADARQPRRAPRLRSAPLRLAMGCIGPAGGHAPRVGGRGVQPPQLGEFLHYRQCGVDRGGLQLRLDCGAVQRGAARRRRLRRAVHGA